MWSPVLSHLLFVHSALGMPNQNTTENVLSCGGTGTDASGQSAGDARSQPGSPTQPRQRLGVKTSQRRHANPLVPPQQSQPVCKPYMGPRPWPGEVWGLL